MSASMGIPGKQTLNGVKVSDFSSNDLRQSRFHEKLSQDANFYQANDGCRIWRGKVVVK
jgi:hypothetical protein